MPLQKSLRKRRSNWPALKLTLPLLALMLTACGNKLPTMPTECAKVAPPAMPELPEQARQVPIPECSPSCTAWLTKQRSEWQKLLNNPEFAVSPVSEHTTK